MYIIKLNSKHCTSMVAYLSYIKQYNFFVMPSKRNIVFSLPELKLIYLFVSASKNIVTYVTCYIDD